MHTVVVGGGAFGTAISCALAQSCAEVTLLVRSKTQERSINSERRNSEYLPEYKLPKRVKASTSRNCLGSADAVFLALPSHTIGSIGAIIGPHLNSTTIVVNLAKGLHARHLTLDKALAKALPNTTIASLKGPTFARPMMYGAPSAMTLAMNPTGRAEEIHRLFRHSAMAIEDWPDIGSVEFISAAKNVFAIIQGICDAIDDNPNTKFLVMQKILAGADRLLRALSFDPQVLFTYAGCGDLLMTSLSDSSRNRTLGLLMGRSFALPVATTGPLLEGQRSINIITSRLKHDRDAHPLIFALQAVFEGKVSPQQFFRQLTRSSDRL
jgi:glycerol-3-phosphate dehydrogenase (NAD(P)+)